MENFKTSGAARFAQAAATGTFHLHLLTESTCGETSKAECGGASDVGNGYNIFLIGIDSVSRNNFHRQFRQTAQYLKHNLSAIELSG